LVVAAMPRVLSDDMYHYLVEQMQYTGGYALSQSLFKTGRGCTVLILRGHESKPGGASDKFIRMPDIRSLQKNLTEPYFMM